MKGHAHIFTFKVGTRGTTFFMTKEEDAGLFLDSTLSLRMSGCDKIL